MRISDGVQTCALPISEAPVIEALVSGDSEGFYAAETESRRRHAMPPYGRLAGIIVSSEDQREAVAAERMTGAAATRIESKEERQVGTEWGKQWKSKGVASH